MTKIPVNAYKYSGLRWEHESIVEANKGCKCLSKRGLLAITLIELLVCISIIALLVAILMLALNKAKEQVKSVVFLNNIRQMGLAAVYFTEDKDDKMVYMVIGQGRYASLLSKFINVLNKLYSFEVPESGRSLSCEPFVGTYGTPDFASKDKLLSADIRRPLK